jgi:hypothetical protein
MEPAPPYAARKTARTPRSRSTQGGVDAAIDPKRLGPSKRRKFIGLRQVRRLQRGGWYNGSRGRRNSEQGLHLWGCDSEAAQARRCRPSPVYEVTSRREPCSSLRRARLRGCERGASRQRVAPALCVSLRCGRSRRAQAWGGVAARRLGQNSSNAACCAPARTTLRETESGDASLKGPPFRATTRLAKVLTLAAERRLASIHAWRNAHRENRSELP